jgi:hypothetical protein
MQDFSGSLMYMQDNHDRDGHPVHEISCYLGLTGRPVSSLVHANEMLGGEVRRTNGTIRIVGVPPGEAPLWVREKWLGLELPLAGFPSPAEYFTLGLSGPRTRLGQLWAVVRGRASRVSGYPVEGSRAVEVLEKSNPEAAAWWREHASQFIIPNRYLVFHEEVCERVAL